MMARTQIMLDPEEHNQARHRAHALGVSLAEYVRRLVKADLGSARPQASPDLVCNLGRSGGADVARNKDAMLTAAYAARRSSK